LELAKYVLCPVRFFRLLIIPLHSRVSKQGFADEGGAFQLDCRTPEFFDLSLCQLVRVKLAGDQPEIFPLVFFFAPVELQQLVWGSGALNVFPLRGSLQEQELRPMSTTPLERLRRAGAHS